jgi:hypothetical protein
VRAFSSSLTELSKLRVVQGMNDRVASQPKRDSRAGKIVIRLSYLPTDSIRVAFFFVVVCALRWTL